MTNRGSQKPHVVAGVDNVASLMEHGREGAALSSLERVKRVCSGMSDESFMASLSWSRAGAAKEIRMGWIGEGRAGEAQTPGPSRAKCHRPSLTQKSLSSLNGKFPLCYC